jgi:ketosteroid isomerase-like protein
VKSARFLYRKIETSDERIQVYGGLAVVRGRAHLEVLVNGHERVADVRYTSVWTKDATGWRTVA